MDFSYDPSVQPDLKSWTSCDEGDRIQKVIEHHQQARVELPNDRIHAAIHVAVENQALLGKRTPVAGVLDRLQDEGLDRHDALHAVGSVLAEHIWELTSGRRGEAENPDQAYYDGLRALTAEQWLAEHRDD